MHLHLDVPVVVLADYVHVKAKEHVNNLTLNILLILKAAGVELDINEATLLHVYTSEGWVNERRRK